MRSMNHGRIAKTKLQVKVEITKRREARENTMDERMYKSLRERRTTHPQIFPIFKNLSF